VSLRTIDHRRESDPRRLERPLQQSPLLDRPCQREGDAAAIEDHAQYNLKCLIVDHTGNSGKPGKSPVIPMDGPHILLRRDTFAPVSIYTEMFIEFIYQNKERFNNMDVLEYGTGTGCGSDHSRASRVTGRRNRQTKLRRGRCAINVQDETVDVQARLTLGGSDLDRHWMQ